MRKYLSIVALLLLVSVILTACGLSDAEQKYNSGTDKFNKGDVDGALADFDEAIKLDPNLAVAYMNRAAVWIKKQDYDKAITDSSKAVDLKLSRVEDQATNLSNRGAAYAAKGDFTNGLADAEAAIKVKDNHASAYLVRGVCRLQGQQDKEGAIADLKKVIELSKDSEEGKAAQQILDTLQAAP